MNISWKTASKDEKKLFAAISILFDHDAKLLGFFLDPLRPKLRARAGILRDDSWHLSEEDALLIRVALDLWSGSGHVQVWELFEKWTSTHWIRFISCISTFFELNEKFPGRV